MTTTQLNTKTLVKAQDWKTLHKAIDEGKLTTKQLEDLDYQLNAAYNKVSKQAPNPTRITTIDKIEGLGVVLAERLHRGEKF